MVWFKCTDLRTHDHEPLRVAHSQALPVLHLFVLDPRWYKWRTSVAGFPRTGPLRAQFHLEALADLRDRLELAGHRLTVRQGLSTAKVFEELCKEFDVASVYAFREVCPEELRVEAAVRAELARQRAGPLKLHWGFELYHRDDLSFDPARRSFHTYSAFRRAVEEQCQIRPPLPAPTFHQTKAATWRNYSTLPLPSVPELIGADAAAAGQVLQPPPAEFAWRGGETAALERVQEYLWETDSLGLDYVGATMTTDVSKSTMRDKAMSKLSPWLAHGCLSARFLYSEIKRYEKERRKSKSTYWIVHELVWRDFVRFGTLQAGSSVFKIGGLGNKQPRWAWSQDRTLLTAWVDGKTGFPFIDCFMRELKTTGYCNHMGRETAGWFLICDLGIDWRMGAEWFENVLLDYEPSANYFNWAYRCLPAIGKELPPRTRLQTLEALHWGAQHDPDAVWIKRWIPELKSLPGTVAREPWRLGLKGRPSPADVSPQAVQAVVAMGFAEPAARRALQRSKGDVEEAVAELVGTAAAVNGQGESDEDALLAQAIELSLSDRPARDTPRRREAFEYGIDYPLPVIQPVSLTTTESIEENARSEQAKRDRQIADTRAQSAGRQRFTPGTRSLRTGDDRWDKAKWEETRGKAPAVQGGATDAPRTWRAASGGPSAGPAPSRKEEVVVSDSEEKPSKPQAAPQRSGFGRSKGLSTNSGQGSRTSRFSEEAGAANAGRAGLASAVGSAGSTASPKRRRWGGEPPTTLQGG